MQVSGLETDLANLWHAVESLGGLQQVIDKHRWNRVVEMLKIPKIVSFTFSFSLGTQFESNNSAVLLFIYLYSRYANEKYSY